MKKLNLLLIKYPSLHLVFIIISYILIQVSFIESMALCEGWDSFAINVISGNHYTIDPIIQEEKLALDLKKQEAANNAQILQERETAKQKLEASVEKAIPSDPNLISLKRIINHKNFVNFNTDLTDFVKEIYKLKLNFKPSQFCTLQTEEVKVILEKLKESCFKLNNITCLDELIYLIKLTKNPTLIQIYSCYTFASLNDLEPVNSSLELDLRYFHCQRELIEIISKNDNS